MTTIPTDSALIVPEVDGKTMPVPEVVTDSDEEAENVDPRVVESRNWDRETVEEFAKGAVLMHVNRDTESYF